MLALSPILVFMAVYLAGSLLAGDFYKVPLTTAFLAASAYAVCITPRLKLKERIAIFSRGAGDENMMLMVWIFILAGAFAQSAKQMGAIDATVNLTLRMLPEGMLLPGLFLAACFISLSVGTSVGTVVALTPVAVGIAEQTGGTLPLIVAIVVGGAFFGDNLSFISDTTIVATQTQGCRMNDKFKANISIAAPAAIIALVIYIILGRSIEVPSQVPLLEWYKVIPYVAVLVLALVGLNVLAVLAIGILLAGGIGICCGSFDAMSWMSAMGEGILGMSELIIVTLLAGGMLALIRHNGGIDYLIRLLTRRISGVRGAKFTIALLVILADLCTANNTIALITVGPMARDIADRYGVDHRVSASLLDTFSCFAQGLIPYGAQLLMAAGLAAITPFEIIGYLYYPIILGVIAVLAILFNFPRRYAKA
ncbi:MAG: Na+/H+ antiporter NhaC family protein [Bacteroidaceae bacterium]|nr:Na+/H+ antiporter NhaC family protein [Bacteroidaceae bacterium]MBR5147839.1 Na+/H+ antiporter NhaC family protein [Bacteroidaceae bacterium]